MLSSNIFLVLISGLGVLHGMFLAAFLWTYKKGNLTGNKILSVLLIILSLRVGKSVLLEFADNLDFKIIFSGLATLMAIGPLFYFYTKSVLDKSFKFELRLLVHFAPTLLGIGFGIWINEQMAKSLPKVLFAVLFLVYYGHYLTYLFLSRSKFTKANKSGLQKETYQFLKLLFYSLLIIWLAYVLNLFDEFIPYVAGPILYTLVAYTVSFIVIQKGYILTLGEAKYKTTIVSSEQENQLFEKVKKLVIEDQQYKNADLTLKSLSEQLKVSPQILSMVINKKSEQNFNSFINNYRIQESIDKFKDEKNDHLTIAAIAFEVGFNSISSFNAAFKNQMKVAPKAYRNQLSK